MPHSSNVDYYGFEAEMFAVNPRGGTLERRPVYASVANVPGGVDMAVLAVRAALVPRAAEKAAAAGARALVVIGGGFAESGPEGRALQDKLLAVCETHRLALIGPNCFGVYSPPYVDTFFLPPERTVLPTRGDIAVASQSGAFLVDQVMTNFHEARIGLSVAVSMGNKAMVDEVVLLESFATRDDTHAICFYLEGTDERIRRFVEAARGVVARKPVVVYVGGKSERGAQAAASHTAALAGNHELMSGALKQSGVLEAETEQEVTSFCKMLSYYHHKPLRLCNVAVISSSGGHGVIASDLCEPAGINIPRFNEERRRELEALLEPTLHGIASLGNPVDLTGSASDQDFERTLDYLLGQEDIEV